MFIDCLFLLSQEPKSSTACLAGLSAFLLVVRLDGTLTLSRFGGKYSRNDFAAIFRIYLRMNELDGSIDVITQGSLVAMP
jgi:hypothetical protein